MANYQKRILAFLHDLVMVVIAWFVAYWLRFNLDSNIFLVKQELRSLPVLLIVQGICYTAFGLYRGVWRFVSMADLVKIIKSVVVGILVSALILFFIDRLHGIPRSVFIIYGLVLLLLLSGSRMFVRWMAQPGKFTTGKKRLLVIGAGKAGESFIRDAQRNKQDYEVVALVDDNKAKIGSEIHGVRVVGEAKNLTKYVNKYHIDMIVIALPSVDAKVMRRMVALCEATKIYFRTLPSLNDITSGRVNISELREVSLEDLLGREQVNLDWEKIRSGVVGKCVMVTGGGGSIGSELCRQIAKLQPQSLYIVDNSEYNLYQLELELIKEHPQLDFKALLVDVTDKVAIKSLMQEYKPELVFHAAAYKHVPMLEYQVRTAIVNNLIGTIIVAKEAINAGVEKFVLISSDKAVNPTNVMGASKRAAEIYCQNLDESSKTQFITTRFGNVIGSSGSVIPLFKKQLANGGPITVTHPEITRFFMTIPEATQLILQTTIMGAGGEIFVLDMGEPIKISYLAEQLIRLSGKRLGEDIKIKYIGLRPGEKLHEELFYSDEKLANTQHKKVFQAKSREIDKQEFASLLEKLSEALNNINNESTLSYLLSEMVPYYKKENRKEAYVNKS